MIKIKVSKNLVGLLATALALNYLVSPPGQTGTQPPGGTVPPTGTWSPRWAVGDVLKSHNAPDYAWHVISINYTSRRYSVSFIEASGMSLIAVDAANLESADIYKDG